MRVLITGANGFVGRAFCAEAKKRGASVRGAVRIAGVSIDYCEPTVVGEIDGETNWSTALEGCHWVVHTAARVHVKVKSTNLELAEYRRVNVEGTLNLARQCAQNGVKRFLFLSSIKVNGENTDLGEPFRTDSAPNPKDAYGISKFEAELGLWKIAAESSMQIVIVRPPLVYGPGVKANFRMMMKCLSLGLPLPLGAARDNRRSMVSIDNLVDFIWTCLTHPRAASQTFLISDGEDLSTRDLLNRLGKAMDKPTKLIPIPLGLLKLFTKIAGLEAIGSKLFDSLQVDISKTATDLNWRPLIDVDEGLRRTALGHIA